MIRSSNHKLQVAGQSPHDIEPTVELVKTVLNLQPASLNPDEYTISWFLAAITPAALRRFLKLIELGPDADRMAFRRLSESYCGIAEPGALSWQIPQPDEIVEEMAVNAPPIKGAVFTIDGRLLIGAMTPGGSERLMSPEEFKLHFRITVRRHCVEYAEKHAGALRRLIQLAEAPATTFEITYTDASMQVGSKKMTVRSKDQLSSWCASRALNIMSMEPINV